MNVDTLQIILFYFSIFINYNDGSKIKLILESLLKKHDSLDNKMGEFKNNISTEIKNIAMNIRSDVCDIKRSTNSNKGHTNTIIKESNF